MKTPTKKKYSGHSTLFTSGEVSSFFKRLDEDLPLVMDTETDGLKFRAAVLGISLYQPGTDPVFISTFLNPEWEEIKRVVARHIMKFHVICHNALYDTVVFWAHGICRIIPKEDSMILIHLYDSSLIKNLETRVTLDFKYHKEKFEKIIGKKWDKIDWVEEYDTHLAQLSEYACEDVYWTYELFKYYEEKVKTELPETYNLYQKIEIPLIEVLAAAKVRGVTIDTKVLEGMEIQVENTLKELISQIHELAGCVFNLNSPKQKQDVFYNKLKLPIYGYTKTGAPSTDVDCMEALAEEGYEIAEKFVEYSSLNKLYTSYIISIPLLCNDDGQLRGNLNSTGARTGRFSSNDPNLQNMPNNDQYPVRSAFTCKKGRALLCLDYSQIEPRLMAHMSKDPLLIDIYHKGGDIYQGIANDLDITRKAAKVVVLAISYGLGPAKLASSIGVSVKKAEKIIADFYRKYKGFTGWKAFVERKAIETLKCTNMFKRIRRFPELRGSARSKEYWGALRASFNTVVQGSAADMLKFVMVKLFEALQERPEFSAFIIMQVHDELLIDCDRKYARETYALCKHVMETTFDLRVPIIAEGKVCNRWHQMKDDSIGTFDLLDKTPEQEISTLPIWLLLHLAFPN